MSESNNREFGVNLWWTCPEFVMEGEKAQAIFEAEGFEPETLPLPKRRKVVSRAAYSFQDRRHKQGRCVVEKVKDNAQAAVYGILWKKDKGAEEAAYEQDTTIRFDKASERVEVEGPQADDFFKAAERYTDAVTDDDVRDFLRHLVRDCKGISKRPSGGIYFVPDRFVGLIESARNALEELDVGARLYVERVRNGEQERQIVWEAVENDIDSQIDATLKAVERIGKRVNAVRSHEAKLDELGGLMDIYRQLLGEEARHEELAERLKEASYEVAAKLAKLQAEVPAPTVRTVRKRTVTSILPEVKEVLTEAGQALHFTEIAERLEARGVELKATKTKTKAQWVAIQINDGYRKGENCFLRLGKGMYALN